MAKKKKIDLSANNLATSVAYAIIGLLLIILKGGSLGILMTAIGVLLIASGIFDVVKGNLTKGAVSAIIGAVIIVCGWLIADIVLLVFGVLLVVKGVLELVNVYKKGLMAMAPSIVTIIIGALLIVSKWALLDVICIVAGAIFIVNAVLTLFGMSIQKK